MKKFFILLTLSLTACAPFGPQANDGGDMQVKNDDRFIEGDMTDVADSNPNFLNLNNDEVTHTNNHGIYREKLRDGVVRSEQFDPGMILNNGRAMIVNVKPKGKYTEEDVEKLKKELSLLVPRYEIRVRVNKG